MTGVRNRLSRKQTSTVQVGEVFIGGEHPVVVQSMTNTDTADIDATASQIEKLVHAGSQLVRITVDRGEAAEAVPYIRDKLEKVGINIPLVGDFHYIGHKLLNDHEACAKALSKYRINPGNVGFREKKDKQFSSMIETAIRFEKPVRIGVNWGSLDQELVAKLMDENAQTPNPLESWEVIEEAMVQSAISSAERALQVGLNANRIVLSCKVSDVQSLVRVYRSLSSRCNFSLHLGLTEAGLGSKGIVASTAAMSILLQEGIGDTIRVSLTPEPNGDRTKEVVVAQQILQSLGIRFFSPQVTACPGCGRTTSVVFQELAGQIEEFIRKRMPEWEEKYPGVENMNVAVMGCIVNGPGESKNADIGISLPGTGESPSAPVFIDGKKEKILKGSHIATEFKQIVENYVEKRYGS
tara:strand:+ start:243 stop:1472 length:1230 start_codon:yes stop_codon:yes gene_type:complete